MREQISFSESIKELDKIRYIIIISLKAKTLQQCG